jgi:hypothetical protein
MAINYISSSKYDTLTRAVTFNSDHFSVPNKNIQNELLRYYAKNKWVYLDLGQSSKELYQVGKLSAVRGVTVIVDLADNSYGRFVREMLYKAIDLSVSFDGLAEVSADDQLMGFRINNLIISNFVRWF